MTLTVPDDSSPSLIYVRTVFFENRKRRGTGVTFGIQVHVRTFTFNKYPSTFPSIDETMFTLDLSVNDIKTKKT